MRADTFRRAFEAGLRRDAAAAGCAEYRPVADPGHDLVRARDGAGGWAGLLDLTAEHLASGRDGEAAASLQAAAPLAPLDAPADLLEAAAAVLRVATPDEAMAVLVSLKPLYLAYGEGEAFDRAWTVVQGGDDPGVDAARYRKKIIRSKLLALLALACEASGQWPAAVERLTPVIEGRDLLEESHCELARAVGHAFRAGEHLLFKAPGPPRVFDLFPYNGELMLLKIKLAQMAPWVDQFVIVEARKTFTGNDKPLYFPDHRAEVADYEGKIRHVVIEEFPASLTSAWAREFYQRDFAARGLSGDCAPDDLVLLSDVDEILEPGPVMSFDGLATSAELRTFRMYLNCELVRGKRFRKTGVVRAGLLAANGSSYLRLGATRYNRRKSLRGAGWHFSSVGGVDALELKLQSYSHAEYAHIDRDSIAGDLEAARRGQLWDDHVRREIDDSFPAYIRDNQDLLAPFIL